jgi:hypothetical protein
MLYEAAKQQAAMWQRVVAELEQLGMMGGIAEWNGTGCATGTEETNAI